MSTGLIKLLLFCLIFSSLFPVFGFALTYNGTSYENTIDQSVLINKGVFSASTSHIVLRDSVWVEFDLGTGAGAYQIHWIHTGTEAGNFTITARRSYGDTGYGWAWKNGWWKNMSSSDANPYDDIRFPENGTTLGYSVVSNYSTTEGCTHTDMRHGYFTWLILLFVYDGPASTGTTFDCDVLFTDSNTTRNNISEAVNDGNVTVQIAKGFNMTQPNFWTFANWYTGLLDFSNPYYVPQTFLILNWVLFLIFIFSAILLAREFIPFFP